MRRHLTALAVGAVLAAVAAGCSSESQDPSTATAAAASSMNPSSSSTPLADPPATEATAVSIAASTTVTSIALATTTTSTTTTTSAATTTTTTTAVGGPASAADLVLRADGIGPFLFGTAAATVTDTLTRLLGAPTRSDIYRLTVPGEPAYQSADGEYGYIHPYAEQHCYADALCATFGGNAAADATFTGWSLRSGGDTLGAPPAGSVATQFHDANGLRIGMRGTDPAAAGMFIHEGGCYTVGGAITTNGVLVDLLSDGMWFVTMNDAGEISDITPPPSDVVVTGMRAGDEVWFLLGDC